jgi:hypothetical protein
MAKRRQPETRKEAAMTTSPAPSPPTSAVSGSERRLAERFPCELNTLCRSLVHPQAAGDWGATILDISEVGLRICVPRRFEVGALLVLELHDTPEHVERLLMARVVHVAEQPENYWTLGCLLVQRLDLPDLRALVDPPVVSPQAAGPNQLARPTSLEDTPNPSSRNSLDDLRALIAEMKRRKGEA